MRWIKKKKASGLCCRIVNYVIIQLSSKWKCRPVLKELCNSPIPRTSIISAKKKRGSRLCMFYLSCSFHPHAQLFDVGNTGSSFPGRRWGAEKELGGRFNLASDWLKGWPHMAKDAVVFTWPNAHLLTDMWRLFCLFLCLLRLHSTPDVSLCVHYPFSLSLSPSPSKIHTFPHSFKTALIRNCHLCRF